MSNGFDPGEMPGPVMAMRRAGDTAWYGRGVWGPVTSASRLETIVVDRGPLFARWITRCIVAGQEVARYDCRLWEGEDFVHVCDETQLGAGLDFRFVLAGADTPAEWFIHGGGEAVKVIRAPLSQRPDPKGISRPGEFIHIDFNSGHNQMSYTWVGFLRGQAPVIGVSELNGGHWRLPGRNRIRVLRERDGVALSFSVNGGSREFALVCGDVERYAPPTGLSQFCQLRRQYSDLPFDKVRHWVTDWPLKAQPRPVLYPEGAFDGLQAKAKAWPELVAGYQRLLPLIAEKKAPFAGLLPAYLLTGDHAIREQLLQVIERELDVGIKHALDNGYLRLIIFDGRSLKVILEAVDVLRARGELDAAHARRFSRRASFLAYCFADPNFWPWDSFFRPRGDQNGMGDDYWDDIGDCICPPNFSTEYWTSFALTGLAYPEHPAAAEWVRQGTGLMERQLAAHFYESGGYCESLNYHAHEVVMLTQVAVGLWAAGRRDFFEHSKFKANFGFFAEMLTPPMALTAAAQEVVASPHVLQTGTPERAVLITNWGNSGHDCSGMALPGTVAVAAGVYAERDPEYARRLMSAWRRTPRQFVNHYSGLDLLVLGRPDLAEIELRLDSGLVEGLGVNMRAGQGTPGEVYGWVKDGTATHHNCRDEGGLVLCAHGAPVIGDFGYHTRHQGRQESGYNTWKHACVTFSGKNTSAYLGAESAQPPEFWRRTPEADLLVAYLPVEHVIPDGNAYLNTVACPRIEHRRFILFVKPWYFVIYDHIPATTLGSTWWVHALADAVAVTPQRARFRGRYGVDLDVQVLLPVAAKITAGEYSVQRHVRIDQVGAGDYLTVLSAQPAGKAPPAASFNAVQQILSVTGEWGTDRVFIAPAGGTAALGGQPFTGRVALLRGGRLLPLDGRLG